MNARGCRCHSHSIALFLFLRIFKLSYAIEYILQRTQLERNERQLLIFKYFSKEQRNNLINYPFKIYSFNVKLILSNRNSVIIQYPRPSAPSLSSTALENSHLIVNVLGRPIGKN